jgi:excisionase family DNA binding protein
MPVEQYYTVGDVSKLLRRSRWTIGRWISDGTLPAIDMNPSSQGRADFRIADSDLQKLIERLKENTVKRRRKKADVVTAEPAGATKLAALKGKRKLSGEKIPKVTKAFL